jgi:hypothetical protein
VKHLNSSIVSTLALLSTFFCWVTFEAAAKTDFEILLRRVVENEKGNRLLEMSYVYEFTRNKMTLGKDSEVKQSESLTFEVTPLQDGDYRRLIKKNGQPLSEHEAKKEQRKLEESIRKHARLSESERAKLEKKRAELRQKEERLWDEVLKAFDFRLAWQEIQHGRMVMIFDAYPRAEYSPSDGDLEILKKIKGRVWIDELDSQISRAEVDFIEDIKFGAGFLVRVNKGGSFRVWKKKVNDEVWFPYRSEVLVNGKIALFKGFNLKFVSDFSNYRKFETHVNLSPAAAND